jgi:hypothetical protein
MEREQFAAGLSQVVRSITGPDQAEARFDIS